MKKGRSVVAKLGGSPYNGRVSHGAFQSLEHAFQYTIRDNLFSLIHPSSICHDFLYNSYTPLHRFCHVRKGVETHTYPLLSFHSDSFVSFKIFHEYFTRNINIRDSPLFNASIRDPSRFTFIVLFDSTR